MVELFNAEMSELDDGLKGSVYQLETSNPMDSVFAVKPEHMGQEEFEDECWFAFRRRFGKSVQLVGIELADWLFE